MLDIFGGIAPLGYAYVCASMNCQCEGSSTWSWSHPYLVGWFLCSISIVHPPFPPGGSPCVFPRQCPHARAADKVQFVLKQQQPLIFCSSARSGNSRRKE